MKFWDSSALVPLLVEEELTPSTLELVCVDDRLATAARREGFLVRDRSRL